MGVHIAFTSIIVLLGLILNLKNQHDKKLFIIVSSIILILISGLRNMYVGPDDTYNYYNDFNNCYRLSFEQILDYYSKDIGFYWFTKIIAYLVNGSFNLYLLVVSALFMVPISVFVYKRSPNVLLSYIVLLSIGIFDAQMVIIRQSIAVSILLFSYYYLEKKNFKGFAISILVASAFHSTALIYIITYPLIYWIPKNKHSINIYRQVNRYDIFIYLLITVFCLFYGKQIFGQIEMLSLYDQRFESYAESDTTLSISGFIQILAFLVMSLCFKNSTSKKYPEYAIYIHLLFLALIFQSFATTLAEFFRVAWYFKVYLIFLIPQVVDCSGKYKGIFRLFFPILLLVYYLAMGAGTNDYAFFWESYTPKF